MLTIPLLAAWTEAAACAARTQELIDSGVAIPMEDPEGKRIGVIRRVWADGNTVYGELEMPYGVDVQNGAILRARTVRVWSAVPALSVEDLK